MCTVQSGDIHLFLIYAFTCLARDVEADSVLDTENPGALGEPVFALMSVYSDQRRQVIPLGDRKSHVSSKGARVRGWARRGLSTSGRGPEEASDQLYDLPFRAGRNPPGPEASPVWGVAMRKRQG